MLGCRKLGGVASHFCDGGPGFLTLYLMLWVNTVAVTTASFTEGLTVSCSVRYHFSSMRAFSKNSPAKGFLSAPMVLKRENN